MKTANPYLNFNGNTEEAFAFYQSVFGGRFLAVVRFRDFGGSSMGIAPNELDKIAHIALPLGTTNILMGTDVVESLGQSLTMGNNFYITLEVDTKEEAEKLFHKLSAGGKIEMALQQTEWAEQYGTCTDKFGIQWMVSYTGSMQLAGSAER